MTTIANTEMAAAWDGPEGAHWAEQAAHYERAGRRLWQRFLDAVPVDAGDVILDIGCGTGTSTRALGRLANSGTVLGVDLSAKMLEHARAATTAEGLTNVSFEQADAQVHPFPTGAFDLAVSSFGAMFFADPKAAFANIGRALRPGGGLALLAWRELGRNDWVQVLRGALAVGRTLPEPPSGAPGAFALAQEDHVRAVLGAAGFVDISLASIEEPIELGADSDDAFAFARTMGITKGLTQDLDEQDRKHALRALRQALADHETAQGVLLGASAWLVTART